MLFFNGLLTDSSKSSSPIEREDEQSVGAVTNRAGSAGSGRAQARSHSYVAETMAGSAFAIPAAWLLVPLPAYAYLDPGSLNMALQLVIAVLTAATAFISFRLGRICRRLRDWRRPKTAEKSTVSRASDDRPQERR